MFGCQHGRAPQYLMVSDVASRQHLRSASRRLLVGTTRRRRLAERMALIVPRHRLSTYSRRAFAVAGPTV